MRKINKTAQCIVFSVVLLLSLATFSLKAHAQTDTVTANESFTNCVGSVNGDQSGDQSPPDYYYVAEGDTIDLTVNNNSTSEYLDIKIDAPSGNVDQTLSPGASYSNTFTASNVITVFATDSSCNDKADYSNFDIEDGNGKMTCAISDNKVWNINGSFSNVAPTVWLYRGSTYVYAFNTSNSSLTIDDLQFSAQSTSQTYYLYNGPGQSYSQIGSATCDPSSVASNTSGTPKQSSTASTNSSTTSDSSQAPGLVKSKPINASISYSKTSNYKSVSGLIFLLCVVFGLIFLLTIVSTAIVYRKAGRPWWAAIVPFYNGWVMYEIGGQAGWWVLVGLIPLIGLISLVMLVIADIEIAKRFGKGPAFAVICLFLFWFIGWPILAFGEAQYKKPETSKKVNTPKDS